MAWQAFKTKVFAIHWPTLWWRILLLALIFNVIYLLWPAAPQIITIHPDPVALRHYAQTQPTLVNVAEPAEPQNQIVSGTAETHDAIRNATHIQTKSHSDHARSKKKDFKGQLHLNTATLPQLQLLPGVGPKTAERILAYRKQIGRFQSVDQLMDVDGIGPKKLEKLRSHCVL